MRLDSFYARTLNNKYFPRPVKFAIVMLVNWLFHGFLYMDNAEKTFYLFLDGLFFIPVFFVLPSIMDFNWRVFTALIIAHTLHWLLNGHFHVLLKNLSLSRVGLNSFIEYAKGLQERVQGKKFILAAAVFGSLSRDSLTESSDLDVRLIRLKGITNGLKACIFVFIERSRAFLNRFPLDIYVLDDTKALYKLRPDEIPVILHDPQKLLGSMY